MPDEGSRRATIAAPPTIVRGKDCKSTDCLSLAGDDDYRDDGDDDSDDDDENDDDDDHGDDDNGDDDGKRSRRRPEGYLGRGSRPGRKSDTATERLSDGSSIMTTLRT